MALKLPIISMTLESLFVSLGRESVQKIGRRNKQLFFLSEIETNGIRNFSYHEWDLKMTCFTHKRPLSS